MRVIKEIKRLKEWQLNHREAGRDWALVPTMGNLHAGHEALVEKAKLHCDNVMVSIYVNPTQFGVGEDFTDYPRTPQQDIERLEALGVDAIFMPDEAMIYPFGQTEMIAFDLPQRYTNILCGVNRPTHFHGVVAVLTRLFNLIQPRYAVFGEKDYQQLWIIRRMVADLHYAVEILSAATVREASGLALSSRNHYLSEDNRTIAPQLQQTLQRMVTAMQAGSGVADVLNWGEDTLSQHGFEVDYIELREQATLNPATNIDQPVVLLAAAYLGKPRILDNIAFTKSNS